MTERLSWKDKLRIITACALAVLFMRTIGWMVAEPVDPREAVMLAVSGRGLWSAVLASLPILLLLTAVVTVLGTVIVGRVLPEAGVFVAGIGLAALALRGGSIHVLLAYYLDSPNADSDSMLAQLAAERRSLMVRLATDCLLWAGIMAVAWAVMAAVRRWLWHEDEESVPAALKDIDSRKRPQPAAAEPAHRHGWLALAMVSVVALFVIWMTIARTPVATVARGQVIAAVAAGLFVGAWSARQVTGVDDARWYVVAPLLVGLVAYLLGYLNAEMKWALSEYRYYDRLATTPPHDLARALPIEYIAVGVSACLAGYWFGRRVEHEPAAEQDAN